MRFETTKLLGPRVTERQIDGWRKIVKDERALVKHVILNQSTLRLAKIIPTWSNFQSLQYYRGMRQFLDSGMLRKYRAWWDLLFTIGNVDRNENRAALMYAWTYLLAEVLHRKHGKPRSVDESKFGLKPERAGELREAILTNYEALTLQ